MRNPIFYDVKELYLTVSTPNKGVITCQHRYDRRTHIDEINMSYLIRKLLGGDIVLITETVYGRADFLWNGKLWDLKCPQSHSNVGKLVQKGIRQTKTNAGGIIIWIKPGVAIDYKKMIEQIDKRMRRSHKSSYCGDIIIIAVDKIIEIRRYYKGNRLP